MKRTYILKEIENGYVIYQQISFGSFPEQVWCGKTLKDVFDVLQSTIRQEEEKSKELPYTTVLIPK